MMSALRTQKNVPGHRWCWTIPVALSLAILPSATGCSGCSQNHFQPMATVSPDGSKTLVGHLLGSRPEFFEEIAKALLAYGIEPGFDGSVAYGIWVPVLKAKEAVNILSTNRLISTGKLIVAPVKN